MTLNNADTEFDIDANAKEAILTPDEPTYPRGQIPTESDRDTYYTYNIDMIKAIQHNASLVGLENAQQARIQHSPTHSGWPGVSVLRSEAELLQMGADHESVILTIFDPRLEDAYCELTAIYLSRREVRELRKMLNKLEL